MGALMTTSTPLASRERAGDFLAPSPDRLIYWRSRALFHFRNSWNKRSRTIRGAVALGMGWLAEQQTGAERGGEYARACGDRRTGLTSMLMLCPRFASAPTRS